MVAQMVNSAMGDSWDNNYQYVQNAIVKIRDHCPQQFIEGKDDVILLGNGASFQFSSIMIFLTGIIYGVSYSMTKISISDWINTRWYLKLIRATLATALAASIYKVFSSLDRADWTIRCLVPDVLIGFIVFGPFVLLC